MSKAVLITGATGKQGGATIRALLDSPQAKDFTILAVTRNAESESAKKLKEKGVKIVQGDLNDVPGIFEAAKATTSQAIWGVFSVQVPMGKGASPATEEAQGKALVDGALENGVKMFVYTSVDRGGDVKSYDNPTDIPHFISKYNIEHHLVERAKGKMDYCILRPVAFLDNFVPGFMGKAFSTMWKVGLKEKPLQFVDTSDIGYFAAQAFIHPDEYKNQGIGLAGDDLTWAQAAEIYKQQTGNSMPSTFEFVAHGLMWAVGDMGLMFRWFYAHGYNIDIQALRKRHPGLLDWAGYIKKNNL